MRGCLRMAPLFLFEKGSNYMFKKKVKFTNYFDMEVEKDLYFGLSESEIVDTNLTTYGGLETVIERITKEKDLPKLVELFKELVIKSYGEVSEDGNNFIKSKDVKERFIYSPAYDIIYMELMQSTDAAIEFVKGIMPKKYQGKLDETFKSDEYKKKVAELTGEVAQ